MSLLRRVLDRESLVKSNIIERLADCLKELQLKYTTKDDVILKNDEATTNFCWIMEAIFIHGLKSPFLKSIVFGHRENSIPEPSFWEFILIFCHQEVIFQINKLSLIHTDVGRCRAWLRLAINEGLLISYLQLMLSDKVTLKEYYKPNALLRDSERLELVKSYLYGIESYEFSLATNSSLLNVWNSGPLSLVGLWSTMDSVSQGLDVVQVLQIKESSTPPRSPNATDYQPLLEEDQALKVILASSNINQSTDESSSNYNDHHHHQSTSNYKEKFKQSQSQNNKNYGSSNKLKSSKEKINQDKKDKRKEKIIGEKEEEGENLRSIEDKLISSVISNENENEDFDGNETDYEALFNTSFRKDDDYENESIENIFNNNKQETTTSSSASISNNSTSITPLIDKFDSKEISSESSGNFSDLTQINSFLYKIPTEVGLDTQNYRCRGCDKPIGIIFEDWKVCAFTGYYYCIECHENDEFVIPSRILLNWDFNKFYVCKQSKEFLLAATNEPSINVKDVNPRIYKVVEELSILKTIRVKLQSIVKYLQTCKDPNIFDNFKKEITREHFYEHVDTYSIADLLLIPNHYLESLLKKSLNFGIDHILNCHICRQKGFVCEICKDHDVIFPFEDKIYKCSCCGAVYHKKCLDHLKPCPRCLRWKLAQYNEINLNTQIKKEEEEEKL